MVHEIYRAQWLPQGTMKTHGFCRRAKAQGSPHAGEKQLGSLCPAQGGHPAWRHDCGAQGAQSNPCWRWSKETWDSHETNPRKPSLAQENRESSGPSGCMWRALSVAGRWKGACSCKGVTSIFWQVGRYVKNIKLYIYILHYTVILSKYLNIDMLTCLQIWGSQWISNKAPHKNSPAQLFWSIGRWFLFGETRVILSCMGICPTFFLDSFLNFGRNWVTHFPHFT